MNLGELLKKEPNPPIEDGFGEAPRDWGSRANHTP